MRDSTKIKYSVILKAHDNVLESIGVNAPYVSKSRIVELVITRLNKDGMNVCRSVVYDALRNYTKLRKEGYLIA